MKQYFHLTAFQATIRPTSTAISWIKYSIQYFTKYSKLYCGTYIAKFCMYCINNNNRTKDNGTTVTSTESSTITQLISYVYHSFPALVKSMSR